MESAAEPDMGALDLGRQGRQQTREEGEARVLVVGSEMGVSSLPGMDQSEGPVFVFPQGSAPLWPFHLHPSTRALA